MNAGPRHIDGDARKGSVRDTDADGVDFAQHRVVVGRISRTGVGGEPFAAVTIGIDYVRQDRARDRGHRAGVQETGLAGADDAHPDHGAGWFDDHGNGPSEDFAAADS